MTIPEGLLLKCWHWPTTSTTEGKKHKSRAVGQMCGTWCYSGIRQPGAWKKNVMSYNPRDAVLCCTAMVMAKLMGRIKVVSETAVNWVCPQIKVTLYQLWCPDKTAHYDGLDVAANLVFRLQSLDFQMKSEKKHTLSFPHISLHVLLCSTMLAEPDHTRTLHELKMFTLNESSATWVPHMGQIHIWLTSSYL